MTQYNWDNYQVPVNPAPEPTQSTEPPIASPFAAIAARDQVNDPVNDPTEPFVLTPALRMYVDEQLSGQGTNLSNYAVIVGHVFPATGRKGSQIRSNDPIAGPRMVWNLEVNDFGVESGVMVDNSYTLELQINSSLQQSGMFKPNRRLMLIGAVRMEQRYDSRHRRGQDDAGLPIWDTRFTVLGVNEVSEEMPNGSWVSLRGEIAMPPVPRRRPVGPNTYEPYATTRIQFRQRVQSCFPGARSTQSYRSILPIEVVLEDPIENYGYLLKKGNHVQIEGRLAPYRYRRNANRPEIQEIMDYDRDRIEQTVPNSNEANRQLERNRRNLLEGTALTIVAGFVEPDHERGTAYLPSEAEIETVLADRRKERRQQRAAKQTPPLPAPTAVAAAFDAVLELPAPTPTPTVARRPRRAPRASEDDTTITVEGNDAVTVSTDDTTVTVEGNDDTTITVDGDDGVTVVNDDTTITVDGDDGVTVVNDDTTVTVTGEQPTDMFAVDPAAPPVTAD